MNCGRRKNEREREKERERKEREREKERKRQRKRKRERQRGGMSTLAVVLAIPSELRGVFDECCAERSGSDGGDVSEERE